MEEKLKNLAPSGHMLPSSTPSGAKFSYCILYYYSSEAYENVVNLIVVMRAQSVLQATPSTTRECVKSLRARDNGSADLIGGARLLLSFELVDAIQFFSGCNSSMEASNLMTDMMHMVASKVLHTPLFTAMDWSTPRYQPAKVFHLAIKILEMKVFFCLL